VDEQGPNEEDCIYTMYLFSNAIQRDHLKFQLLKKASWYMNLEVRHVF